MNEFLKERLLRRLEALPEERVYQVLDYVEFLETRYATSKPPEPNVVQKLAEEVQNVLRRSNASAQVISETMKLMSKAAGAVDGVRAAAESFAGDVKKTFEAEPRAKSQEARPGPAAPPASPAPPAPPAPADPTSGPGP